MSPKATDEGCWKDRCAEEVSAWYLSVFRRLTPLEHPSSVSALRADPPSPTRGEGEDRSMPEMPYTGEH
ncbi:hypothetical protein, partial [Mesorhizobium sp. M2A.F.Ca.ET.029.05.1.1]|uniref:hypothetical protein n=1 Tax=Mesorhizobium sp. M2A.F.Ca.ET.029.05.1.1 TaxID=2496658 RepID=UPI001AECE3C4